MACTLIGIALIFLATLHVVEPRPTILFKRTAGNENVITLTCALSCGGSPLGSALFRRDGVILNLNNESMASYQFHITPDGEGGFTCEAAGDGERSEVLLLAGRS